MGALRVFYVVAALGNSHPSRDHGPDNRPTGLEKKLLWILLLWMLLVPSQLYMFSTHHPSVMWLMVPLPSPVEGRCLVEMLLLLPAAVGYCPVHFNLDTT